MHADPLTGAVAEVLSTVRRGRIAPAERGVRSVAAMSQEPDRRPSVASPRTSLGVRGEQLAAEHLEAEGLELVARNWRLSAGTVRGELDLVAMDHAAGTLVVCEVKTRRGDAYGGPLLAVTRSKQAKIRELTVAFLRDAGVWVPTVRFDVVGVWLIPGRPPRIEHVVEAF